MPLRHHLAALALVAAVGAPIFSLAAQRAMPAGPLAAAGAARADSTAGCTYATCAVRVEPSFWNGARLVRGVEGTPVVGVNALWPQDLSAALAGSDSAVAYGRRYAHSGRLGSALSLGGAVVAGAGLSAAHPWNAATFAGLGMAAASIPFELASLRSLNRAVWWYNASVATSKPER
jgi:hypothetical protein